MKPEIWVAGAVVVNELCAELGYTRPHVINILKENRRALRARKDGSRWWLPVTSIELLRQLIVKTSGRRYKLGETGCHQ